MKAHTKRKKFPNLTFNIANDVWKINHVVEIVLSLEQSEKGLENIFLFHFHSKDF